MRKLLFVLIVTIMTLNPGVGQHFKETGTLDFVDLGFLDDSASDKIFVYNINNYSGDTSLFEIVIFGNTRKDSVLKLLKTQFPEYNYYLISEESVTYCGVYRNEYSYTFHYKLNEYSADFKKAVCKYKGRYLEKVKLKYLNKQKVTYLFKYNFAPYSIEKRIYVNGKLKRSLLISKIEPVN